MHKYVLLIHVVTHCIVHVIFLKIFVFRPVRQMEAPVGLQKTLFGPEPGGGGGASF